MIILVTGASGFIGGKIAASLAMQDPKNHIIATGRSHTEKFQGYPNITYQSIDLSKKPPTIVCDICIHCAGLADDNSTKRQFELNNEIATKHLIGALKQCQLLIYISSASVYDFSDSKIKTEEDTGNPLKLSLYGNSKLKSEAIVSASRIPSIYILRPRAVYGNGDRVLLPRILKLIRKNKMVIPKSTSSNSSLTHIDNLLETILVCIQKSKNGIHHYNVSDKRLYSIKDVFSKVLFQQYGTTEFIEIPNSILRLILILKRVLGLNIPLSKQSLDYLTQNAVVNIRKLESELNYHGKHHFMEFIESWNTNK